ncbi:MAG: hypothetical protein IKC64_06115 [Clostridia bacterium]|nr:hypothetical protein [Clostridia bacterium]
MKYKVIGWTHYDDTSTKEKEVSWAAQYAIIDDIKAHGYLFTGFEHQECWGCCPVLNDGKKRTFSQRGWGEIMAEAKGDTSLYGYSSFMTNYYGSKIKLKKPEDGIDESQIVKVPDLNENFTLEVSDEQVKSAVENRELIVDDLPLLRYVDQGDTLTLLVNGEERTVVKVLDVDREKEMTKEERLYFMMSSSSVESMNEKDRRYNALRTLLKIRVEKKEN